MIIVCPECNVKFAVPAEAIPKEGRKVKCSKCAHIWHQNPLDKVADLSKVKPPPKSIEDIAEESNLPARHKRRPEDVTGGMKSALAAMLAITAILSFFLHQDYLTKKIPFMVNVYNAAGLHDTKNVSIGNVQAGVKRVKNKLEVDFKATMANLSEKEKVPLADIKVTLLSEKGNVMNKITYNTPDGELAPQANFPLQSTINNISGSARRVVLDVGNWLEFLFRPKVADE